MIAAASLSVLAGCDRGGDSTGPSADSDKPRVVATVNMIADVAREIAGPDVEVINLVASGLDPHLYKPTADDLALLRSADLVLYNGHHLEGKMGDALEQIGRSKPVVALAEKVPDDRLIHAGGDAFDPHLWMDPALWSLVTTSIADALVERRPADTDAIRARHDQYVATLADLRAYGQEAVASIPNADARLLVTSHDAFSYFGQAFSIDVMAVQGISTESDAGLAHVNDLVDTLVTRRVPAVFVESSVSPKGIQALIDGAASRGHTVTIGGELFSDATGPDGTYEGTYVGMIDHNITTVTRALGGRAEGFRAWRERRATTQPATQSATTP